MLVPAFRRGGGSNEGFALLRIGGHEGESCSFFVFCWGLGGRRAGKEPSGERKTVGHAGSVPGVAGLESRQLCHIETASLSL